MNPEELKTAFEAMSAQLHTQQQKGFQNLLEQLQSAGIPVGRERGAHGLPATQVQFAQGGAPLGLPPGSHEVDLDEEQHQDNEVDPQWSDILKSRRHAAMSSDSQTLGKLLSCPPPLIDLKRAQADIR